MNPPDLIFSTPFHIEMWVLESEDKLGSITTEMVVHQTVAFGFLQHRLTSLSFTYEDFDRFHLDLNRLLNRTIHQATLSDMDQRFVLCFQAPTAELRVVGSAQQVNLQLKLTAESNLNAAKACLEKLNLFPKWW